jgi:hypothetical protein
LDTGIGTSLNVSSYSGPEARKIPPNPGAIENLPLFSLHISHRPKAALPDRPGLTDGLT